MEPQFILKLGLSLLSLLYIFPLTGGDPVDPSEKEKSTFASKILRLKSNVGDHPYPVTDVLNSLEETIMKMVECPPTAGVEKVIINVKTKQIKWDRGLTLKGESAGIGLRDIGWYQWAFTATIKDNVKTIEACNYILLDSATMFQQEMSPPFGPLADEALLYHELLHGQLVIDSIMNNPSYQDKLCNCTFDLSAGDFGHKYIPTREKAYLKALLQKLGMEDPTVHIIDPPAQKAQENGKFRVEVAEVEILEEKEEISFDFYLPSASNIVGDSVKILIEDDKIVVRGCLVDKTKPGLIAVVIDPDEVVLFIGLEQAILILPSGPNIPAITFWGTAILFLSFSILGLMYYKNIFPLNKINSMKT